MDLLQRVQRTLEEHKMIPPKARVLVACSGGADSVALLMALRNLGHEVAAAHYNHQTRDGGSDNDEEFVEALCARLDVPLFVGTADVALAARERGESFEVCARELRYRFLERIALERQYPVIATGHHADDQIETILFRLLRGTHPSGLSGIPFVRPQGDRRVVRPLIACEREEIRAWLHANGQDWRDDPSNADPRYLRNRIRHHLLPLLRAEYNPGVDAALRRLSEHARWESDLVEQELDEAHWWVMEGGEIRRDRFAELHPALQHRIVHASVPGLGAERVREAAAFIQRAETGAYFDLDAEHQWLARKHEVVLVAREQPEPPAPLTLEIPGAAHLLGRTVLARLVDAAPDREWSSHCTDTRQVFDADALGESVTLRTRREGDRIAPLGMRGSKKFKDWCNGAGVASPERDRIPLLARGGDLLWIPGGPVAASVAVTPETKRLAEVEILNATE